MQKNNWKKCKLGDVCQFQNGKKPSFSTRGIFPVYGGNGAYGFSDFSNAKPGNIVIGRVGAYCGSLYYLTTPSWITDNAILATPSTNERFLFYLLCDKHLNRLSQGGAQPLLNQSILNGIEINLPSLEEQKRIVDILGAFDDKIELLQKQNRTLEDMAKAIFKSWFVDFDVVKAKQRGDRKADIMREYHLTEELYNLFPSSFEDSSLGPIPSGWEIKTAKEMANIVIGRTPPRKETQWFSLNPTDYTWISIKDLGQSGIFINSSSEYLTLGAIQRFRIPIIPANTVVLSFKLTVGRVAITGKEMTSNEAIAQFQNARLPLPYLYFVLKFMNYELLGSTSSIATAINSATIKNMPLMVPLKEILDSFDNRVKILFNKIQENQKQIQTLTELRDSLLPRLISGKIEV